MKKQLIAKIFSAVCIGLLLIPVISYAAPQLVQVIQAESAPQYVTLSAFSGHPAEMVQVSGGGYSAFEELKVFIDTPALAASSVQTLRANLYGDFGPVTLQIPVTAEQGSLPISVADTATGLKKVSNAYYVQPFTPVLEVTSSVNTPSSTIAINGSGFAPNESVALSLGSAASSATANASGNFVGATLVVPNMPSATYQLRGVGQSSSAQALAYFYIGAFYVSSYPSSYYLLPGDTLNFSGAGYASTENIRVYEGQNTTPITTFMTDASGAFDNQGAVAIPFSFANSFRTFRLVGQTSQAETQTGVTVGQFFPNVSPSIYYAMPGDVLSFSGSQFAKSELVKVFAGTNLVASFTTDNTGNFMEQGSLSLPYNLAGTTQTFKLVGSDSNAVGEATVTIGQLQPSVSPSSYYILPGQKLLVSGLGFAANELVELFDTTSTTPFGSFMTDVYGGFTEVLARVIPYNFAGTSQTFSLIGATSKARAALSFGVGSLSPQLSPSDYYLKPGQAFSLSGSGFGAAETVAVTINGTTAGSGQTDADGMFTLSEVMMPFGSEPAVELLVTGESSQAVATLTLTRGSYYPYLSASEYYVLPGKTVVFSGNEFAPSESIAITGPAGFNTTMQTAADGSFSTDPIAMPYGLITGATYSFTGQSSNASQSLTIGLASFYPWAQADTYYTQPGSVVTVSGSGFAAEETVTITAGSFSTQATTDAAGAVAETAVTLPYGVDGTQLPIVLTGAISGATASVPITLAPFYPEVTPSTYYAAPGTPVTFTGSGFIPGETVNVMLNGSLATTTTVSGTGTLTTSAVALPYGATVAEFVLEGTLTQTPRTVSIGVAALHPGLSLNNYYAAGGTPITIYGSQFASGETVSLTFGGANLGTTTAGVEGNFTLETTVPFAGPGEKTVQAVGVTSGGSSQTTFTQAPIYVSAQLGAYAVAAGNSVTFIGSGYLPNEPVTIMTDRTGSASVHQFNANTAGQFSNSGYVLPGNFAEGNVTLTISGTHSFTTQSIVLYVLQP